MLAIIIASVVAQLESAFNKTRGERVNVMLNFKEIDQN